MRVADTTLTDTLAGQLNAQQGTIANLDAQLSSGVALQKPSDNPIAVVDTIGYERQISQLGATTSAASTASSWLGIANQTANSVLNNLQSVRTLVLQALNSGSQTAQSYSAIATQIQGQAQSLLGLANTTYAGTAIFSGTAGGSSAYTSAGTYQGNTTPFTIDLGNGQKVAASVPGTQLFGSSPSDVFTTLKQIVTDLGGAPGGTTETNLQTDLNALNANITQATSASASLGEAAQQVQTVQSSASATSTQVQTILSNTRDVNVAQVTTQLQADLANYQAALYASSQAVPETLAAFLK
ncbi:MAG TPA: hypothetical protein VMU75_12950 [Acidimicrobiales bacterium]|nr:hypothetical protein [Acidimicrobiales bacterium]